MEEHEADSRQGKFPSHATGCTNVYGRTTITSSNCCGISADGRLGPISHVCMLSPAFVCCCFLRLFSSQTCRFVPPLPRSPHANIATCPVCRPCTPILGLDYTSIPRPSTRRSKHSLRKSSRSCSNCADRLRRTSSCCDEAWILSVFSFPPHQNLSHLLQILGLGFFLNNATME